ncbi:hypothetical protein ACIKP9_04720 [Methylobacillus methanolivorans]|uniref:Uncharacterized protein n=1 Tax=Methylobacillus methanolivorans TaxID=1848927 RepID=A0ABW8GJI5_9PROT
MADNQKKDNKTNLVILDRPMISVETTEYKEVRITVIGMDGAMENIRQQELLFPLECAEQVAQFLLQLAVKQ